MTEIPQSGGNDHEPTFEHQVQALTNGIKQIFDCITDPKQIPPKEPNSPESYTQSYTQKPEAESRWPQLINSIIEDIIIIEAMSYTHSSVAPEDRVRNTIQEYFDKIYQRASSFPISEDERFIILYGAVDVMLLTLLAPAFQDRADITVFLSGIYYERPTEFTSISGQIADIIIDSTNNSTNFIAYNKDPNSNYTEGQIQLTTMRIVKLMETTLEIWQTFQALEPHMLELHRALVISPSRQRDNGHGINTPKEGSIVQAHEFIAPPQRVIQRLFVTLIDALLSDASDTDQTKWYNELVRIITTYSKPLIPYIQTSVNAHRIIMEELMVLFIIFATFPKNSQFNDGKKIFAKLVSYEAEQQQAINLILFLFSQRLTSKV